MAPWELEEQPICWRDWALIAQAAEHEAETERHKVRRALEQTKVHTKAQRRKGGLV